jgi:archaellum component FlaF (FlaF/FlaG flagellin family)
VIAVLLPAPTLLAAGGDTTPPSVTAAHLNASHYEAGDTVALNYTVSDASNVTTVQALFCRDANCTHSIDTTWWGHEPSGTYSNSTAYVSNDTLPGNYSLVWIYAGDEYGNGGYASNVTNLSFTVGDPNATVDVDPPVLTNFAINGTQFYANDELRVSYDVSDASNLTNAQFTFCRESNCSSHQVSVFWSGREPSGSYDNAYTTLPANLLPGNYTLSYVYAWDQWGNMLYAEPHGPTFAFGDANASVDDQPPVLEAVAGPGSARAGDSFAVNYTVSDASNIQSAWFDYCLDDSCQRSISASWYGNETPGSYGNATGFVGASTPPGLYKLRYAYVEDVWGNYAWGTNGLTDAINVTSDQADLVVSNVTVLGNLTEGESTFVFATVQNVGAATAGPSNATVYADGLALGTRGVPSLAPGATYTVGALWNGTTAGTHTVTAFADSRAQVKESDEGNNVANVSVYVAPLPRGDLAVKIVGVDQPIIRTDAGPIMGNPVATRHVHVNVTNLGNATIAFPTVTLTAQGRTGILAPGFVGSTTLADLAPGETREVTFGWSPVGYAGDVDLKATVSAPRFVDVDSTNNADTFAAFVLVGGLDAGLGPV